MCTTCHTMSFVISGSYYYIFLGEFVIKHYISTKYTIVAIDVSFSKECLIKGMDDLDYLMENISAINEFDKKHKNFIYFDTNNI